MPLTVDNMFRHRNTDSSGKPFAPETVQAVWDRTEINKKHHPLKMDVFGSLMWREAYGNANSKLGWEIDHIVPVEAGGGDDLDNLQALQWENNRRKAQLISEGLGSPEARNTNGSTAPEPTPRPLTSASLLPAHAPAGNSSASQSALPAAAV